jgi:HK97 family phage prohead protease
MTRQAHHVFRKSVTPPPGAPGGDELMYFIASSEAVDSYEDVIEQSGWDFKRFDRNPVFLAQHNSWAPPAGTIPYREVVTDEAWLREQGVEGPSALTIGVKWDVEDERAMELKGKYDRGVMSAVSVGFRPLEYEPIKGTYGYRIKRAELLEVSAVTIGANPEATAVRSLGARHWAEQADEELEDARALARLVKRGLLVMGPAPTGAGDAPAGEQPAPGEPEDIQKTAEVGDELADAADTTHEPAYVLRLRTTHKGATDE